MKATSEYQIKYLYTIISDIFEYYSMQDSIITVDFTYHELMDEFKFEYYFIDIPMMDDEDEIEDEIESRIRDSFKVGDAYVYLKPDENKIEITLHDDMVLRFDYEAMVYMRDEKLDSLL